MGKNGQNLLISLCQVIGDLILVNVAVVVSFLIRFHGDIPITNFSPYLKILPYISVTALILFNFYGLYHTENKSWAEITASLIASISILALCTIALSYMFQGFSFPRSVLLIAPVIQLIVLCIWRYFMFSFEKKFIPKKKTIIIAPGKNLKLLLNNVVKSNFEVVGIISDVVEEIASSCDVSVDFSNTKDVFSKKEKLDAIIMSGAVPEEVKEWVAKEALKNRWQVFVVPELYEIMVAQSRFDQIQDTPVFEISLTRNSGREQVKRIIDVVIAGTALLILLPIMLLIALAIKIDSPGPIFYVQERVSIWGKRFLLYKFRTMVDNAEELTGPVLASEKDPRVTRVGRFLRATRLDELPQLVNVIKGDMSIVGPRPERPIFVEQYIEEIPEYKYRHLMKAGITGLAQVSGKYSTSVEDKLRYDLLYVKRCSPLLDFQIMLHTLKVIFMKEKSS